MKVIECIKCNNCDLENDCCKLYGSDPNEAIESCAENNFMDYRPRCNMRLIDTNKYRDILVEWIHNCFKQILAGRDGYDEASDAIASCVEELDKQPTIDPIKHGRWEWFCNEPIDVNGHTCYSYGYRCTACHDGGTCWIGEGKLSESEELFFKNCEPVDHKYCPDCGAKMDLE